MQALIVGVDGVVRVAVDDPHKWCSVGIVLRDHQVEIYLTRFSLDLDLEDALEFELAFLSVSLVEGENFRMEEWVDMYHLLDCLFDGELGPNSV